MTYFDSWHSSSILFVNTITIDKRTKRDGLFMSRNTLYCILLLLGTALGLSGCQLGMVTPSDKEASLIELSESANTIASELTQFADTEADLNAVKVNPYKKDLTYYQMHQLTSIDWSGPVEPLLRRLAYASHYQLRVLGNVPAIPPIVTIHKRNAMVGDLVYDAALQVRYVAAITVFPQSQVIELSYNPVAEG